MAERGVLEGTESPTKRPEVRWLVILVAVAAVMIGLAYLPFRARIPPLVESDYCYILLAADRSFEGMGLTSLQPIAPLQPWSWQYDWGFLTQWPIGYPLLVRVVRAFTGSSTLEACKWISTCACALALLGWFVWVKRCVPRGVAGVLLAAVGAGCSVSAASLINPSTDVLLVAMLPFVLLFTIKAVDCLASAADKNAHRRGTVWLIAAGLVSGGLFWIRYASIFVPVAIGIYLLVAWWQTRKMGFADPQRAAGFSPRGKGTSQTEPRPSGSGPDPTTSPESSAVSWRDVMVFSVSAAVPIVALLAVNSTHGTGSAQSQLNLGSSMVLNPSPRLVALAWWNFTDLGFYDYHWQSHWVYALWPVVLVLAGLFIRRVRHALVSFVSTPAVGLSLVALVCMLGTLITATALFGSKFNYVALERYYVPGRPLYFLLFVAPVVLVPRRFVRVIVCVGLLVCCSWIVQVEWPRPYRRWLAADRAVTPYGQWSRCFEPGAAELYKWLADQASPDLIVVSNFHEYLALETKLPTLPIPKNVDTLNDWIERISTSRGITEPRVLFILDPDNKWRNYWIPDPTAIVTDFDLQEYSAAPKGLSRWAFEYAQQYR